MQSPHELYAQAFPKDYGHAFWLLEPSKRPEDYFKQGVQIGDVLIRTHDGGYDYLFNVCRPADHVVNNGRVWEGFSNLEDEASTHRDDWQSCGSCIGSSKGNIFSTMATVSATALGLPLDIGASFAHSRTSGALLFLPDGASRTDLLNIKSLKDWIASNIHQIFEHVNGPRFGRETKSLFIVTGCDKSTESIVATSSNVSDVYEIWAKLSLPTVGGLEVAYSSIIQTLPVRRVTPLSYGSDGSKNSNHCSFTRGFTCTMQRNNIINSKVAIKVGDTSNGRSWLVEKKGKSGFWGFLSSASRNTSSSTTQSAPSSSSQDSSTRTSSTLASSTSESNISDLVIEIGLNFTREFPFDPWNAANEAYLDLHPELNYVLLHTSEELQQSLAHSAGGNQSSAAIPTSQALEDNTYDLKNQNQDFGLYWVDKLRGGITTFDLYNDKPAVGAEHWTFSRKHTTPEDVGDNKDAKSSKEEWSIPAISGLYLLKRIVSDATAKPKIMVQYIPEEPSKSQAQYPALWVHPHSRVEAFSLALASTASEPRTTYLLAREAVQRSYTTTRTGKALKDEPDHPTTVIEEGIDVFRLPTTESEIDEKLEAMNKVFWKSLEGLGVRSKAQSPPAVYALKNDHKSPHPHAPVEWKDDYDSPPPSPTPSYASSHEDWFEHRNPRQRALEQMPSSPTFQPWPPSPTNSSDEDILGAEERRRQSSHYDAFGTMSADKIQIRKLTEAEKPIVRRAWSLSRKEAPLRQHSALERSDPAFPSYSPPWITLSPGKKQNKLKRALQGHGLLPDRPQDVQHSPLDGIPKTSFFVLLPLWTEEVEQGSKFLLVWYKAENEKSGPDTTASSSQTDEGGHSFVINARVVSRTALQGSSIKIPVSGLRGISSGDGDGPHRSLPEPSLNTEHHVLAHCSKGSPSGHIAGIQFEASGLQMLGLAIGMPTADGKIISRLTSVGRAVVELTWLGAVALTEFLAV